MEWLVGGVIVALLVLSVAGIIYLDRRKKPVRWNRKQRLAYDLEQGDRALRDMESRNDLRQTGF